MLPVGLAVGTILTKCFSNMNLSQSLIRVTSFLLQDRLGYKVFHWVSENSENACL